MNSEVRIEGIWLGALEAGSAKLRVQLRVKALAGELSCAVDSLDQGAADLPCANVRLDGNRFSFEVPAVRGRWSGTLSADGNRLDGTWSQGRDLSLNLVRQAAALEVVKPKAPEYDAAMEPVPLDKLQAVLDRDLAEALKSGALSPKSGGGAVIGVVDRGRRLILAYGDAKPSSIFEIGSITKTFTGLMLARMAVQGKVRLEEPVRELLPEGTVAKPTGEEITLLDLATQHSGLPRLPDDLNLANQADPYADYTAAKLYAFLAGHGVAKPANAGFSYSNLGVGLLGQALSNRSETTYPEVLKKEITEPLGLKDTAIKLSREQESRLAQGHSAQHRPARPWNMDALAGAGAIRSTANDMLTYLEAQLHPDSVSGMAGAIKLSQELRGDVSAGMKIALAWIYNTNTGNYWHNGATGGYSSCALFNHERDYGVVVLYNTTISAKGSFADRLGEHVSQRLSGKPAVSLAD
jgi:CubicO group peptidase (beta-lactamase class C family)